MMGDIAKHPYIKNTDCVLCGECIKVCHVNAVKRVHNAACAKCLKYCTFYEVTCNNFNLVIDYNLCDSCGDCVVVCKDQAIVWVAALDDDNLLKRDDMKSLEIVSELIKVENSKK